MCIPHNKPFSPACARNKAPILHYLRKWLGHGDHVLEIGSGTGEHGVYFAKQLAHIHWQCTDRCENLVGLQQWIPAATLANLSDPFALDVNTYPWGTLRYDAVFSANTLHIMAWQTVKKFLKQVHLALHPGGKLILYGPLRYQGAYTSKSNAAFDAYLQAYDGQQGIRDMEAIQVILQAGGFTQIVDQPMPAHNQLVLWQLPK